MHVLSKGMACMFSMLNRHLNDVWLPRDSIAWEETVSYQEQLDISYAVDTFSPEKISVQSREQILGRKMKAG
jgi:hypothetical protein